MKVAICQSNYIPWKGYFDLINSVDLFIFHDDVQYTKQDWRNRNRIKTPDGVRWLTIPVGSREDRLVCDVELPSGKWRKEHWRRLEQCYQRAPFFSEYRQILEPLYFDGRSVFLSDFNQSLIFEICSCLDIETRFEDSRRVGSNTNRTDRIIDLLTHFAADCYLSGPAAKAYLDVDKLDERGIAVEWMEYSGYREYSQINGAFRHDVSVLDLLFNMGSGSSDYLST